jgi:hypothetical protein
MKPRFTAGSVSWTFASTHIKFTITTQLVWLMLCIVASPANCTDIVFMWQGKRVSNIYCPGKNIQRLATLLKRFFCSLSLQIGHLKCTPSFSATFLMQSIWNHPFLQQTACILVNLPYFSMLLWHNKHFSVGLCLAARWIFWIYFRFNLGFFFKMTFYPFMAWLFCPFFKINFFCIICRCAYLFWRRSSYMHKTYNMICVPASRMKHHFEHRKEHESFFCTFWRNNPD